MLRRLLAFLLVVWAPLNLSLTAAALLNSLADRGWPAIVLLVVRLAVTGFGVAAGRALWSQSPRAPSRWRAGRPAWGSRAVLVVDDHTSGLPAAARRPRAGRRSRR